MQVAAQGLGVLFLCLLQVCDQGLWGFGGVHRFAPVLSPPRQPRTHLDDTVLAVHHPRKGLAEDLNILAQLLGLGLPQNRLPLHVELVEVQGAAVLLLGQLVLGGKCAVGRGSGDRWHVEKRCHVPRAPTHLQEAGEQLPLGLGSLLLGQRLALQQQESILPRHRGL